MMMEANYSAQSNMRSTKGKWYLSGWKTGCMWVLGCREVSTANSLVLRHSASVHIGTVVSLNNAQNYTLFSPTRYTDIDILYINKHIWENGVLSRYKQHKTDFEEVPSERPLTLPCQVRKCRCPAYQYIPRTGPNPVRCLCKHLPQDHCEAMGHLCKKCEFQIIQKYMIHSMCS